MFFIIYSNTVIMIENKIKEFDYQNIPYLPNELVYIIADFVVSGKPPRSLIITADPLLAASRLVLPKGSSHLEQTTDTLTFFKKFKIKSLFLKPRLIKLLCSKYIFSLGSSPITYAFQFLYLSKIFIIVLPKISKPLAEFNFPIKVIIFFLILH